MQYSRTLYTVDNLDDLLDANNGVIAFQDKLFDIKIKSQRNIAPRDYITNTCN